MGKQMGKQTGKVVGENALVRVNRLLKRFNERYSDPEVEAMESIMMELEANGSGRLAGTENNSIFHFEDLEQLVSFLEAPIASQVFQMVA